MMPKERTPSLEVQARGMGVRGRGPEDLFVFSNSSAASSASPLESFGMRPQSPCLAPPRPTREFVKGAPIVAGPRSRRVSACSTPHYNCRAGSSSSRLIDDVNRIVVLHCQNHRLKNVHFPTVCNPQPHHFVRFRYQPSP